MRGHFRMEHCPAHSDTLSAAKLRLYCQAIRKEANSAQRISVFRFERNSHSAKRCDSVRHQTFAARLITRWPCSVANRDSEPSAAQPNRSRQSRRTATHNKYVCVRIHSDFLSQLEAVYRDSSRGVTPQPARPSREAALVSLSIQMRESSEGIHLLTGIIGVNT